VIKISVIFFLVCAGLGFVCFVWDVLSKKQRSKNSVQEEPGFIFESGECELSSQEKKDDAE
jgi:hypothetical protein